MNLLLDTIHARTMMMKVKKQIVIVSHSTKRMFRLIHKYMKKGYHLDQIRELGCFIFKTYYVTMSKQNGFDIIVGPIVQVE